MKKNEYWQTQTGKERGEIVKEWYENLPPKEKNAVDRSMKKLSSGIPHMDIIGMLELVIALDCSGKTSLLIGG